MKELPIFFIGSFLVGVGVGLILAYLSLSSAIGLDKVLYCMLK